MKCPKCGFNSFETHDACKKCGNDLSNYKNIHGLKAIVMPAEARTAMAQQLMADRMPETVTDAAEPQNDMFSFDEPAEPSSVGASFNDDPFNFDDIPETPAAPSDPFGASPEQKTAQAKAEEEAFADLLESSPSGPASTPAPAAAASPDDLSNFSWDDTPEVTEDKPEPSGDAFDDLFGDSGTPQK